jgi:AcrR family transcriptional regulator
VPGEDTVTASDVKRRGDRQFPLEDPSSSLPETAQRILAAATRLLADRGYEAVTLENVAAEAGVNKASIRYNFGNKAGLVMAIADNLIHDECLRLAADTEKVPQEERLHVAMLGIRRMIVEADSFRGFFDILPHAFRDPELRERMFSLYAWWYQQNLKWLGLGDSPSAMDSDLLMGLAELIAAIPDGLSVQAGLNPEGFDLSRPLATLEFLLRNSMSQLVEIAAREGATGPEEGREA